MNNGEIKLTKVTSLHKKETYEEAIQRHLAEMPADYKKDEPQLLFVGGITPNGVMYQILTDNSVLEILGALEVLKASLIYDHSEE